MREELFKRKLFCILMLCMVWSYISFGQVKDSTAKKTDATPKEDKANVLIIPFKPTMYTAYGDQYICQKSRMTPGELSDMIRRSLTSTLMYNMTDLYNVVEPPNDLADKNSDLNVIYQITQYSSIFQKVRSYFKGYPDFKLGQILGPQYLRWGTDCVNDNAQFPHIHHHKYVRADIIRDSLFSGICKRYNAHFALYITQFEMTTRFKNCTDLQNQVYQRDIFIHYTLLNSKGAFIDGGIIGTTYQSNSNDATKILEKNLGMLTGLIIDEIRRKL